MGVGFCALWQKDTKPTFTNSFTWVKGNHTYKFGGEAMFEGLPIANGSRSNGIFGFSQAETADPYATGLAFQNGATGFAYASFLLGNYSSLNLSPQDTLRLGNHSFGIYAQDTWKISRKLTIDYGLRYDYATLLSEQHGRMQDAAFNTPNAAIGGRIGGVIYGGTAIATSTITTPGPSVHASASPTRSTARPCFAWVRAYTTGRRPTTPICPIACRTSTPTAIRMSRVSRPAS